MPIPNILAADFCTDVNNTECSELKYLKKKKVNYPSYGRFMGSDRCLFDFASHLLHGYIDTHFISLLEELNTQRGTGHKVVAPYTVIMEHAILKRLCREVSNPNFSFSQKALFFCFIVDFR